MVSPTNQIPNEWDGFISASPEDQDIPSFMQYAALDFQHLGKGDIKVQDLAIAIQKDFDCRQGTLDCVIVKIAAYWIFPVSAIASAAFSVASFALKSRVSFLHSPRTYAIYSAAFFVISGALSYVYDWQLRQCERDVMDKWRTKDEASDVSGWHLHFGDDIQETQIHSLFQRCLELSKDNKYNTNTKFINFFGKIRKYKSLIEVNRRTILTLPKIAQKVLGKI